MSKPILYKFDLSPVVRSVMLVAKAINLDLELRTINMLALEHLSPEFIKLNPHHTVPTLNDNGHIIWDSHAIITYLVDKYANGNDLYPTDLAIRSTINQRLFFNASILFPSGKAAFQEIFIEKLPKLTSDKLNAIDNGYKQLNVLFDNNKFLVGDTLTIADLSCITTVLNLNLLLPIDKTIYPKIISWIELMNELPYLDEINGKAMVDLKCFLEKSIEDNNRNTIETEN